MGIDKRIKEIIDTRSQILIAHERSQMEALDAFRIKMEREYGALETAMTMIRNLVSMVDPTILIKSQHEYISFFKSLNETNSTLGDEAKKRLEEYVRDIIHLTILGNSFPTTDEKSTFLYKIEKQTEPAQEQKAQEEEKIEAPQESSPELNKEDSINPVTTPNDESVSATSPEQPPNEQTREKKQPIRRNFDPEVFEDQPAVLSEPVTAPTPETPTNAITSNPNAYAITGAGSVPKIPENHQGLILRQNGNKPTSSETEQGKRPTKSDFQTIIFNILNAHKIESPEGLKDFGELPPKFLYMPFVTAAKLICPHSAKKDDIIAKAEELMDDEEISQNYKDAMKTVFMSFSNRTLGGSLSHINKGHREGAKTPWYTTMVI